ncbi:HAD family hydrolase [Candidatus Lokiarchaeum ossiferum]|uniref:HAD family hydrolase n=1 Tax=Candidatus Lokiarchaeum ossiferum TaxID=2951803 RepID=UPI00352DA7AC
MMNSENCYIRDISDKNPLLNILYSRINTSDQLLQFIKKKIRSRSKQITMILDLDGTLIDNFPRQMVILQQHLQPHFPHLPWVQITQKINQNKHCLYSIMEVISEFVADKITFEEINAQFLKSFLSEQYLHHDQIIPGAKKFLQQLYRLNVEIIFLTGRPAFLMTKGTLKTLQKIIPPFERFTGKLIMKPNEDDADHKFKIEVMDEILSDHKNSYILYVDNEGSICNQISQEFTEILVWHYLSTQSNNEEFNGRKLTRWKLI